VGLNDEEVLKLITLLENHGKVFITSERRLPDKFEKYRISIKVNEIAHALYFADLLIADSQTMSAEAGVLGTPYIRFNDFVGRISYLEELENKYKLGYGIKTKDKDLLFNKVNELLNTPNLKEAWKVKRTKASGSIRQKTSTEFMLKTFD
jgi:predicted glycosyltransferase